VEPFVRRFLRASLVWFALGVGLGFGMAVAPGALLAARPAHAHANLLGFVTMMIFGVAYHVIPRFTGAPLHSPRLAAVHVWVANLAVALLVAGCLARVRPGWSGAWLLHAGAALGVLSAGLFVYNVWRTLGAGPVPQLRIGPAPRRGAGAVEDR